MPDATTSRCRRPEFLEEAGFTPVGPETRDLHLMTKIIKEGINIYLCDNPGITRELLPILAWAAEHEPVLEGGRVVDRRRP